MRKYAIEDASTTDENLLESPMNRTFLFFNSLFASEFVNMSAMTYVKDFASQEVRFKFLRVKIGVHVSRGGEHFLPEI